MGNETREFFEQFQVGMEKMKQQTPDAMTGFMNMFDKIMKEGALSLQQKELIALAIGVSERCKPCICMHTQKALDAGATRQQILEAAEVAVMMGGGPAYTHIPVLIKVLDDLGA